AEPSGNTSRGDENILIMIRLNAAPVTERFCLEGQFCTGKRAIQKSVFKSHCRKWWQFRHKPARSAAVAFKCKPFVAFAIAVARGHIIHDERRHEQFSARSEDAGYLIEIGF